MNTNRYKPARAVLRYFGGKFRLAPWLIAHLPPHRIYVEPYTGAASVLLRKSRSLGEVMNDVDGNIVNLFRVLRDEQQACELERQLRLTPFARDEYLGVYEESADPIERARRLLILSFMGFGADAVAGLHHVGFRARGWRKFTTAPADWAHYPDHIGFFTARLQGVVIENRPAATVIRQQDDPEALFYVDPPYPQATRPGRHGYRHEMTDDDHRELAEVLHDVRGMVALSGYRCALYDELFGDWESVECPALADGARPRVEVLWRNPAALAAIRRAQPTLGFEETPR